MRLVSARKDPKRTLCSNGVRPEDAGKRFSNDKGRPKDAGRRFSNNEGRPKDAKRTLRGNGVRPGMFRGRLTSSRNGRRALGSA